MQHAELNFSHCNIKTFNMVQLMEDDSDKDQINK